MTDAPPGTALTRRMYELRSEGYTFPAIAARIHAEGLTVPSNGPAQWKPSKSKPGPSPKR